MDLGLARIQRLLQVIGDPQKTLRVVHVAGTNGKGSICAYVSSVLHYSGLSVGRFNSPHLLEPRDSIWINGESVSQADYDHACRYIAEQNKKHDCGATSFEQLVAVALWMFQRAQLDWVVVEVGLGGLLDATNVFEKPNMVIISSIGWDHVGVLGNTIELIATAKAGIMKHNCPVVIAPQEEAAAQATLEQHAKAIGSPYLCAKPAKVLPGGTFCVDDQVADDWHIHHEYTVPLHGDYQRANSATAVIALDWLQRRGELSLTGQTIREGIAKTRWPGRLDWVTPAIDGIDLPPILVDGAHNPQATRALREYVNSLKPSRVIWIIGATTGKDIGEMMNTLLSPHDVVLSVPFSCPVGMPWIQCVSPDDLTRYAQAIVSSAEPFEALKPALQKAAKTHTQGDIIVLCGSLYLVADFYRLF